MTKKQVIKNQIAWIDAHKNDRDIQIESDFFGCEIVSIKIVRACLEILLSGESDTYKNNMHNIIDRVDFWIDDWVEFISI